MPDLHRKPNHPPYIPIMIAVFNVLVPVTLLAIFCWAHGRNEYLGERVLHRVQFLWQILPLLWIAGLLAALLNFSLCVDTPCERIASVGRLASLVSIPLILFWIMVAPLFPPALWKARQAGCLSNVKQISLALIKYAQDHDGQLPPGDNGTSRRRITSPPKEYTRVLLREAAVRFPRMA